MFKEIAVDPAAVATSYRDFSYIIEKFGVSEGRLIAAFPGDWKKLVYDAAHARLRGTMDLSRIEVRLKALKKTAFYRRGRPGDGCAQDWIAAAILEHTRVPFDAIIAAVGSEAPDVVAAAELDGEHACLKPNRQWQIERDPKTMANCCAPLLSKARRIKLVDPHFDLNHQRYCRPFTAMLSFVQPGSTVEVFRGDNYGAPLAERRMREFLNGIKPDGVTVVEYFLPQKAIHNRFVLTEMGGLVFKTGLDDKDDGQLTTDVVSILQDDVWAVEWERFTGDKPVASWP